MSWRFQLLGPGEDDSGDYIPLQEVKGSAPVFHQIYWNGKRRYFGQNFPPGRYQTVLSATDMRNRTRKLRSWIKIEGKTAEPESQAPASASAPSAGAAPPDALPGAEAASSSVVRKAVAPSARSIKRRPSRTARASRRKSRTSTRRKTPAKRRVKSKTITAPLSAQNSGTPPPEEDAKSSGPGEGGSRAGAVNYQVLFEKNTSNITREGDNILQRVADTMHYYPLDNINLVGYSYTGESDPDQLAIRRAQLVSKLLVERHGMKRERIQVDTKSVDYETAKVEIYIVAGGQ